MTADFLDLKLLDKVCDPLRRFRCQFHASIINQGVRRAAGITGGRMKSFEELSLPAPYSNPGGTLRLVACSNAYPSSMRRGSLQAIPVKLTPNGPGLASNPSGNGGVAEFGTIPNGTITVGYPGFAASPEPL